MAMGQATPTPNVKLKFPGTLMIGDTPCGEAYISIHKSSAGRSFMWHLEGCQALEDLVNGKPGPGPNPTPTPKPTSTPGGSVIPGDPNLCPDGFLSEPMSKTGAWYGLTVDVPQGVTRRFCAPVTPQLVPLPAGQDFYTQITFQWYDVTDQDCGALNVHVDATDGFSRPRGGTGFSASGNYYYYGKVGSRILTPDQTKPGIYVVTLTGGATSCSRYRITWNAY
ncbi:MAG TPA: hypothetical protein VIS07_05760 [Candidatus Binatia bacterium]